LLRRFPSAAAATTATTDFRSNPFLDLLLIVKLEVRKSLNVRDGLDGAFLRDLTRDCEVRHKRYGLSTQRVKAKREQVRAACWLYAFCILSLKKARG
jgi:hypothetical protein